jgi:Heparinase II/III-like protein
VIFPLTVRPFSDYRPVLNAVARTFLDYDLPHGPWDDLSLWFGIPLEHRKYVQLPRYLGDQIYGKDSWAYFRTAQFITRPSHADQLHLDLWWQGLNIARDAGTYRYTAEFPWDNSLTAAQVHNTVTVDGRDQMTRLGRFLYLDWVNAYRRAGFESDPAILQQVRGRYRNRRQGYRHTRLVTVFPDDRWRIEDEVITLRFLRSLVPHGPSCYRLHWLLPDWEWQIEKKDARIELRLRSPRGWVVLAIQGGKQTPIDLQRVTLVRAGEALYGSNSTDPARGWISPTYGVKIPALSLAVEVVSADDVQFISEFAFP